MPKRCTKTLYKNRQKVTIITCTGAHGAGARRRRSLYKKCACCRCVGIGCTAQQKQVKSKKLCHRCQSYGGQEEGEGALDIYRAAGSPSESVWKRARAGAAKAFCRRHHRDRIDRNMDHRQYRPLNAFITTKPLLMPEPTYRK